MEQKTRRAKFIVFYFCLLLLVVMLVLLGIHKTAPDLGYLNLFFQFSRMSCVFLGTSDSSRKLILLTKPLDFNFISLSASTQTKRALSREKYHSMRTKTDKFDSRVENRVFYFSSYAVSAVLNKLMTLFVFRQSSLINDI